MQFGQSSVSHKHLLTSLARAVLKNSGPGSFLYEPSSARSVQERSRAKFPQYCPSKLNEVKKKLINICSTKISRGKKMRDMRKKEIKVLIIKYCRS